jgi:O-antigen/teichoic acid export membrane protein
VFRGLRLRPQFFSLARLREITTFSVYMLLIDWANKLNYSVDALVIGAFLNTSAVAVWAVGQRVAETTQRLTNQLNEVLFPTVVDNDTTMRLDRLRTIFLIGTRLSLASVTAVGGALILMARPLMQAWVGPGFADSATVLQLLALTVIFRVGNATATTVLKGAGRHRLLATANVLTAVVNLSMSVAVVRRFALPGVAIATLVPVSVAASLILFPAGCRRVQLPIGAALAHAVWPAVWPAGIMAAFVASTRSLVAPSMPAIGLELAAAVAVYCVVFLAFGVTVRERQLCIGKALELIGRSPLRTPTIAEGA